MFLGDGARDAFSDQDATPRFPAEASRIMPMPKDDDEDLYEDDFEFVDDDDLDADLDRSDPEQEDEEEAAPPKRRPAKKAKKPAKKKAAAKRKKKEEADAEPPAAPDDAGGADDAHSDRQADDESVDEFGRPEPAANYVVHIYEFGALKRTIDRDFTPEDAEAFATEYTRTAKPYRRFAVAGKKDTPPKKALT